MNLCMSQNNASERRQMTFNFSTGSFYWPLSGLNQDANLKYLYKLGFTYDSRFNLISIAGLIELKNYDINKPLILNFNELNELIDLHYDLPFNYTEIIDIISRIKYYYKDKYYFAYDDLNKSRKKCINKNLSHLIKRFLNIVGELNLNGEDSEALKENLQAY